MKPAFNMLGGKSKISKKIVDLIPRHTVWCEIFAGSAAVTFSKPYPNVTNLSNYVEVLNDNDKRMYTFYKTLMDPVSRNTLLDKINLTPYHEQFYRDAKNICKNIENYSDIDVAWAFFINISMSFANKLGGGWGRSVFKYHGAAAWKLRSKDNLENVIKRLDHVYFSCEDALKCAKNWDSPQTCIYADPPYPNTEQGHYKGYTQQDFDNLINFLANCKSSFLLSCYDNPSIPKEWERFEFKTVAHVSGKGKVRCDKTKTALEKDYGDKNRTEVLLRVIRNQNVRSEIKELFESGVFDCFV